MISQFNESSDNYTCKDCCMYSNHLCRRLDEIHGSNLVRGQQEGLAKMPKWTITSLCFILQVSADLTWISTFLCKTSVSVREILRCDRLSCVRNGGTGSPVRPKIYLKLTITTTSTTSSLSIKNWHFKW